MVTPVKGEGRGEWLLAQPLVASGCFWWSPSVVWASPTLSGPHLFVLLAQEITTVHLLAIAWYLTYRNRASRVMVFWGLLFFIENVGFVGTYQSLSDIILHGVIIAVTLNSVEEIIRYGCLNPSPGILTWVSPKMYITKQKHPKQQQKWWLIIT